MSLDMQQISWPGWETVRLIGRGSFGAVYEIQRDVFGETEKAALKVISIPQNDSDIEEMYNDGYDDESITSTFQSHLKSIVAEYSLMRKMNGHTNIVSCDDMRHIQHDDGIGCDIFIKMELLTPLTKKAHSYIRDHDAIALGMDICAALSVCKKYGVVHRDIKPQNIFVSDDGNYKLGDFGVAKTVEKTMGGTKIGTEKYMAPEVCFYKPYGCAADIYSLGLVLYWMLNERRLPFLPLPPEKVKASEEQESQKRRLRGEQIPPPIHGSEQLKQIVLKACAYDLQERYATPEEMEKDLAAISDRSFLQQTKIITKIVPQEVVQCAACGEPMLPNRRFCIRCGAVAGVKAKSDVTEKTDVSIKTEPRKTVARTERKQKNVAVPPEKIPEGHCCHCGKRLLTGRSFCIQCGEPVNRSTISRLPDQSNFDLDAEEKFRLLQQEREKRRKEQEARQTQV